jgi:hypothetical protein
VSYVAQHPVLLVEGDGDKEAVPFLLRRMFPEAGCIECFPAARPIMCGDIPKLRRVGELEKYIQYGCNRADGDSVILIVDCDDGCPATTALEFSYRVSAIANTARKKVGIAFMYREFENIFLNSLRELEQAYPELQWALPPDVDIQWDDIRAAKGTLNNLMRNHYYKETRDQARFVSALNIAMLRTRSRSIEHILRLMGWLTDPHASSLVYPRAG